MLSVLLLVIVHPFVDVFFSVLEQAADESGHQGDELDMTNYLWTKISEFNDISSPR